MTPTQQFRSDARLGGITDYENDRTNDSEMLLKPTWWQAVGKTRGWHLDLLNEEELRVENWREHWILFIDHLADGKNIDEALAAIN